MPPPIFWERPYFPSWDPNIHYANYHTQDDNYYDEYYNHRGAHNECCRYDSDTNLNINKPKLMSPPPASPSNYGGYCSNRFYTKPTPIQQQHQQQPHQCYSCERSASSIAIPNAATPKFNKVQRTRFSSRNELWLEYCLIIFLLLNNRFYSLFLFCTLMKSIEFSHIHTNWS